MQHKYCFEAVHRLLLDLQGLQDDGPLFGGVPAVLGGDFAQILPVVPQGSCADVVKACLQQSFIWQRLKRLHLQMNMRVRNGQFDSQFVDWISGLSYNPSFNSQITLLSFVSQLENVD